jgi:rRNA maturation protein Nop10
MAKHILFCENCKIYTMQPKCKVCDSRTLTTKPPKFSPDDKYQDLKRGVKQEEYKSRGLL